MLPTMASVFANPLSETLFDSEVLLINQTTYKDYWVRILLPSKLKFIALTKSFYTYILDGYVSA